MCQSEQTTIKKTFSSAMHLHDFTGQGLGKSLDISIARVLKAVDGGIDTGFTCTGRLITLSYRALSSY